MVVLIVVMSCCCSLYSEAVGSSETLYKPVISDDYAVQVGFKSSLSGVRELKESTRNENIYMRVIADR